mgnify:CR=1 FL=1
MWECCQCLNVKTGNSDYCEVCGHNKCSACFETQIPDSITNENEQLYYFELKKLAKSDRPPSPVELASLKTFQKELDISIKRAKEIVKISDVKIAVRSFYFDKNTSSIGEPKISDKKIIKKKTPKIKIPKEAT